VAGSKIYVHCLDEIGAQSYAVTVPLEQSIKNISPYAKNAKGFSEQMTLNDGNYETFTSESGESCVAVRKFGQARGKGYKWIVHASECVPIGKRFSQDDIGQFMSQVGFRD
jgi:hypothetical protein